MQRKCIVGVCLETVEEQTEKYSCCKYSLVAALWRDPCLAWACCSAFHWATEALQCGMNENNTQCMYRCLTEIHLFTFIKPVHAKMQSRLSARSVCELSVGCSCHNQTYCTVFLEEILGGLELAVLREPFLELCSHGMKENNVQHNKIIVLQKMYCIDVYVWEMFINWKSVLN